MNGRGGGGDGVRIYFSIYLHYSYFWSFFRHFQQKSGSQLYRRQILYYEMLPKLQVLVFLVALLGHQKIEFSWDHMKHTV